MITVPIYDTKTGKVINVSPGVRDARLKYDNASKIYNNQTNRGLKGRYLPAEEAPQTAEAPALEKKTRTRRTTAKK